MTRDPRGDLLDIYAHALARVAGDTVVERALAADPLAAPVWLVAIGKAASAMTRGALAALGGAVAAGLVITKRGHLDPAVQGEGRLRCVEADHPVPGESSLLAGKALLGFLQGAPPQARFLFLISGGASSLVEVLPDGLGLSELRQTNEWLLGSGLPIDAMNRVRRSLSRIKGGRLATWLAGRPARCLLISDVPGDDPSVIGSGLLAASAPQPLPALPSPLLDWVARAGPAPLPGDPRLAQVTLEIVADLHIARSAAAERARMLGYAVSEHAELLTGDAFQAGRRLTHILREAVPGLHLWAGETTVRLPPRPGRGGRNQHLALSAALELAGRGGLYLLAAGTDGTDGPTEDAGALVDGGTLRRCQLADLDPFACLERADAGRCLEASGDLIQTGPTGTNVMDLVLGLRLEGA